MNKGKKAISLLLCACVLFALTACFGDNNSQGTEYGRYVEVEVTPTGMKGEPMAFYTDQSGIVDIICEQYEYSGNAEKRYHYRYRSTDFGLTWAEIDMGWTQQYVYDYSHYYDDDLELPEYYVNIGYTFGIQPDGAVIYCVNTVYTEKDNRDFELFSIDLQGNTQPFDLPVLSQLTGEYTSRSFSTYEQLSADRVWLEIYQYDEDWERDYFDSKELRGIFDSTTWEMVIDFEDYNMYSSTATDRAFLWETPSGEIKAASLVDGSPMEINAPTIEQLYSNNIYMYMGSTDFFIDDDLNFYGVNSMGLQRVTGQAGDEDSTGNGAEVVMSSLNYNFGNPSGYTRLVRPLKDGTIMMCVMLDGSPRLYRYEWDENAAAKSDKEITIFTLYENDTVRYALWQFQMARPEITVNYEVALDRYAMYNGDSGAMTKDDAVRALNTRLLAGTGPDILVLDGLPYTSYVERGALEDISAAIEPLNLIDEAITPMYTDDKLYAVPTRFGIPLLFGEEGYVEQLSDFDTLVAAILDGPGPRELELEEPDYETGTGEEWELYWREYDRPMSPEEMPVMQFGNLDALMVTLFEVCGPAIYDNKTGLDEAQLTKFLQIVKDISDKFGLTDYEEIWPAAQSDFIQMGGTGYYYSPSMDQYMYLYARAGMQQFISFNTLRSIAYANNSNQRRGYIYTEDGEEIPPDYEVPALNPVAIHANGMAEGLYSPSVMLGVCSTSKEKELAMEFLQVMLDEEAQSYGSWSGLPVNRASFADAQAQAYELDDWDKEANIQVPQLDMQPLLASIQQPYIADVYIQEVIYDALIPYCQDNATLEQTVAQIKTQTEIYFAEMQ